MVFTIIRSLAILLVILASSQPASAARDIYFVTGVNAFIESKDSNTARALALEDGEKKAYKELVKRFLDYGYMDKEPNLSEKQIDQIISKMKVKNERITDTSYNAELDFWFNPIRTAKLFNIANDEGVPTRAKYLIIPVLVDGNYLRIWGTKWLEAWQGYRKKNLIVPLGDLDDLDTLQPKDLVEGDYKGVDALARRYKAPIIIIAKAEYTTLDNALKVKLEKLEESEVTSYEFEYPAAFGVGAAELYDVASNDITYRLQNNQLQEKKVEEATDNELVYSRNYNVNRADRIKELKVKVLALNLGEWSRIRKELLKTDYIEKLEVDSFKADEVLITIKYNGTLNHLTSTINQNGLNISQNENSNWVLKEANEEDKATGLEGQIEDISNKLKGEDDE